MLKLVKNEPVEKAMPDKKHTDQPMLKDMLHGLASIEGCRVVHVGKLNSLHTPTQTHLKVIE